MAAEQQSGRQLAVYGSLKGKRVFIARAGSAIGETIVTAFSEQGAKVAFVDIARERSQGIFIELLIR